MQREQRPIRLESPMDLAKYALASVSMKYAKAFVPVVRQHLESEEGAIAFGALCGYYARPFMKTRGFGCISLKVVPKALR